MMSQSLIYVFIILLVTVVNLPCSLSTQNNSSNYPPWFITLYISCPSLGTIQTCGRSLINENWILTTATCVQCKDNSADVMVVADIGTVFNKFHSSKASTGVVRYY